MRRAAVLLRTVAMLKRFETRLAMRNCVESWDDAAANTHDIVFWKDYFFCFDQRVFSANDADQVILRFCNSKTVAPTVFSACCCHLHVLAMAETNGIEKASACLCNCAQAPLLYRYQGTRMQLLPAKVALRVPAAGTTVQPRSVIDRLLIPLSFHSAGGSPHPGLWAHWAWRCHPPEPARPPQLAAGRQGATVAPAGDIGAAACIFSVHALVLWALLVYSDVYLAPFWRHMPPLAQAQATLIGPRSVRLTHAPSLPSPPNNCRSPRPAVWPVPTSPLRGFSSTWAATSSSPTTSTLTT